MHVFLKNNVWKFQMIVVSREGDSLLLWLFKKIINLEIYTFPGLTRVFCIIQVLIKLLGVPVLTLFYKRFPLLIKH